MGNRRDFFTQIVTGASQVFSRDNPQIRDVGLDSDGSFRDLKRDERMGDPLDFDKEEVRNKLVLVNFFTTGGERQQPIMGNLAQIAKRLDRRMEKEVLIQSVTLDPERDTRKKLDRFAKSLPITQGWNLVRASQDASKELVGRMNRLRGYTSQSLVFYGVPGAFWGTFPGLNSPDELADRIARSIPGPRPQTPRRAGPARRGEEKYPWTARQV